LAHTRDTELPNYSHFFGSVFALALDYSAADGIEGDANSSTWRELGIVTPMVN